MTTPVRDRRAMIAGMDPWLRPGEWVFCAAAAPEAAALLPVALASFREDEGVSLVLPRSEALRAGFDDAQVMACITLRVHSALDGVGLTAGVAGALADAGIPCNMIAAFHHDHAFVPLADAERALHLLRRLAALAARGEAAT
ncbi:MAG: ACT domain-containing protein [Gemmobacter sp.]